MPDWPNQPSLIFDIWALWRAGLHARVPKCQKITDGWLGQYGTPDSIKVYLADTVVL